MYFALEIILVVGYGNSGADYDRSPGKVLQIYRKENLKLNEDTCQFRCTSFFFSDFISRESVKSDLRKCHHLKR